MRSAPLGNPDSPKKAASKSFAFHFRRNVTHLFGVSGDADILSRDIERAAGSQIRSGRIGDRLLREDDLGENQQECDGTNEYRRISKGR